jgi:hypothetical protein
MRVTPIQLAHILPLDPTPGTELVAALAELAASSAATSFQAAGELEDVLLDAPEPRTLMGRWTLLSLQGFVGPQGGPWVLLARSTDGGPQLVGGRLAQATVVSVSGQAFASLALDRLLGELTAPSSAAPLPTSSQPTVASQAAVHAIPSQSPSQPGLGQLAQGQLAVGQGGGLGLHATAMPKRPERPQETNEVYPEDGDVVTHFHFGRCVVISSDGERIRLQNEGDSKVREVALSMLKIEPPTLLEDGRKHFELLRKH